MVVEDWETISIGAVSGAMIPAVLKQEQAGTTTLLGLNKLPSPLDQKPVQGSLLAGGLGIGLAWMGARGKGPISGNESGINFSAALGAASLGGAVTMAMYPGQGAPAGVRVASPEESSVEIGVAQPSAPSVEGEATMFEREETEAATPSGETLGGI